MTSRVLRIWLAVMVLCLLSSGQGQSAPYRILVVNSRQQGIPWTYNMMGSLEATLLKASADVELQIDYMHTARFVPGREYYQIRSEVYGFEFSKYRFDVIISVGEDALQYLRLYGDRLFPGAPILFCGVSMSSAKQVMSNPRAIVVASDWNLRSNIELIKRLRPEAREIFLVHDSTSEGLAIAADVRAVAPDYPDLRFRFLTDMSMSELLRRIRGLPHDTALVTLPFTIDKAGEFYPPGVAARMMSTASPVPTFGLWSFEMDDGLTGGLVLDEGRYGEEIAKAALRIAKGKNVRAVHVPLGGLTHYVFDYRRMREFGILSSLLPKGARVIHKPGNVFQEHRAVTSVGLVVFGLVLATAAGLAVFSVLKRRAAEARLRLERETNAHKRSFYRETLLSVTHGRLEMCEHVDAEPYIASAAVSASLREPADMASARALVREFCASQSLGGDELSAFMIAVGEAMTNAVKHAPEGHVYAGAEHGELWVAVSDCGPGIDSLILPRVVLERGFSTKLSLGMGYTVMLDVADRLLLCTNEHGTTVILIKNTGADNDRQPS